jgi:hypothetical protein
MSSFTITTKTVETSRKRKQSEDVCSAAILKEKETILRRRARKMRRQRKDRLYCKRRECTHEEGMGFNHIFCGGRLWDDSDFDTESEDEE